MLGQSVIASDIDEVAVDVARVNAQANGVGDLVHCVEAAGFQHDDLKDNSPYDLVFANILKGPLIELAPEVALHTSSGGHVILSGILNPQAADVIAAYDAQGLDVTAHAELGDWTTLTLRKRP